MTATELKDQLLYSGGFSYESLLANSTGVFGTSFDSPFIPVFGGKFGKVFVHENRRILLYQLFSHELLFKVSPSGAYGRPRSIGDLIIKRTFGYFSVGSKNYHFIRGCIFDAEARNKVLLCLAVRREKFWRFKTNFNTQDMVLFVSSALLEDARYKSLKIRLKSLFSDMATLGIDTMVTSSVERWCIRIGIEAPVFTTLQERLSFFSDIHNFIPRTHVPQERPAPEVQISGDTITITTAEGTVSINQAESW